MVLAAVAGSMTATAASDAPSILPATNACVTEAADNRRRPGRNGDEYPLPICTEGPSDDRRVEPWVDPLDLGPPVPNRWRIVETIGIATDLLDPYSGHNPLKGDLPIYGDDWFYSLIAISDTVLEPRRFPLPVGTATTARPHSMDTIGLGDTLILSQSIILENVFYQGDTVYRPPDWEFRFTPVININQVFADEKGLLNVNPDRDATDRLDTFMGIQALFVDRHLRNVSDRFDFDSIRVGIQPFSSDFRGFVFQDSQFGARIFGTRTNNIYQYNLAWFRRLEKDTNSGLNDVTQRWRDDDVFVANIYRQDFPRHGFTSQATIIYNRNREGGQSEYDKNGFIARPAALFEEIARDYDVIYLGYSGDGHFDRLNISTSAYIALGHQDTPLTRQDIAAGFLAAEFSMDFDWLRPRLSLLWSSGDTDPFDDQARGFDAIFENPQFAGGDTSFWIRQNVPLIGGGGVAISGRNGVLPSLRSSKEQGQSNFINPGLTLVGMGADADLTPQLRLSMNWNYLRFNAVSLLERLRQQAPIASTLGNDLSLALTWRPFMTQNVVFRLSAATLVTGPAFRDLYGRDTATPYSVLANLVLMY